jgi:hypothetical protein
VVKRQPEEIPDADHELVIERVCAIDVAKASGAVCLRLPGQANPARRVSRVWQVPATTRAVTDLAARLVAEGVEKVTVESTSDYVRRESLRSTADGGSWDASGRYGRSAGCA